MLKQKTRVRIETHTDGIVMSLPIILLCRKESCLKMHLMFMCSYNTQHVSKPRPAATPVNCVRLIQTTQ